MSPWLELLCNQQTRSLTLKAKICYTHAEIIATKNISTTATVLISRAVQPFFKLKENYLRNKLTYCNGISHLEMKKVLFTND
jgi:hypothetical protein